MEYNKRQFQKSNDKKVLHKVKKHWVVMSMALLMAIGGKAVAMHISAHADTTNDNGQTSNTDLIKEHLNQQLTKAQQGQSAQNQSQTTQNSNANSQQPKLSITSQAKLLHNQILRNASNNVTVDQNTTQGRTNQVSNNQPQPKANVTPQSGSINQQKSNVTANAQSASQDNNVQQSSTSQSSAKGSQVNAPKNPKLESSNQASLSANHQAQANKNNNQVATSTSDQGIQHHRARLLGGYDSDYSTENFDNKEGFWGTARYHFSGTNLYVSDGQITNFSDFKNNFNNSNNSSISRLFPFMHSGQKNYLIQHSDQVNSISFNNVTVPSNCAAFQDGKGEFFPNQHNVTLFDASGLDMSNATNMDGMFSKMAGLTCGSHYALHLNFAKEPNNLQSMGHTFSDDPQLRTVDLGDLNTSNVHNMSSMMSDMGSLFDVELGPNFNTASVTDMGDMFHNDNKLTSLDLGPNFNTSSVQNMNNMFSGTSIKNLNLGNQFSSQSLNSANNMLPSGLQTLSGMWGSAPYTLNLDTHTLTVNSGQIQNLNQINQNDPLIQEVNAHSINNVKFNGDVTVNGSSSDIIPDRSDITQLGLSGLDLSTASNVAGTFKGLTKLNSLNLASDGYLNSLSQNNFSNMFNGDSNLTNLNLGELNVNNATNMSGMFQGLSNLTTLNLHNDANFNTGNVNNMSDMFDGDVKLSHLDLGANFNAGNVNDANNMMTGVPTNASDVMTGMWGTAPYKLQNGTLTVGSDGLGSSNGAIENFNEWANSHQNNPLVQAANNNRIDKIVFKNGVQVPNDCSNDNGNFFPDQANIKDLDVSGLNMSNVSDMNGMFSGMSSLINSDYGNKLSLNFTNMPNQVTSTNHLFDGDSSLHELDLSTLGTYGDQDMSYMFNGMSQLSDLQLGNTFGTNSVTNMDHMFNGLSDLSSLNLGNQFNTSNVGNMSDMFHGMNSLTNLNLGQYFNTNSASDMNNMFSDMSKLTDLNLGTQFNAGSNVSVNGILSNEPALQTMEGQWNGAPYTLHINDGQAGTLDVGRGTISNFTGWVNSGHQNNPLTLKSSDIKKITFANTTAPTDCSNDSGNFFPNQGNVTNVDVSGLNMSNANQVNGMFAEMPNLTNSDYGNTLTLNFNGMPTLFSSTSKMFKSDSSLQGLNLNNLNTQSVNDMSDMFKDMHNLSNLQLGQNFYTNSVNKMSDLFRSDSNLRNINLGQHFVVNNGTNTKNMFNSSNMVPNSDTISGVWDTAPYTLSNGTLTVGSDGHGDNNGGSIDNFTSWVEAHSDAPLVKAADNGQIKNIVFKNGVTVPSDCSAYSGSNGGEFFPDQESVSDLDVSGLNMSGAHNMSGMFANMYHLNNDNYGGNLTLNFQQMPSDVTDTANLFSNDYSLANLNLNSLNTQNVWDMSSMFNGMSNLNSLTLGGNFNTQNVQYMNNMFNGLSSLANLDLGSQFNTGNVYDMSDMFHGMTAVHQLKLGPNFNTQNVNNFNNMFSDMTSLSDLNLGTQFNVQNNAQWSNFMNTGSSLNTMEGQWNGAPYTLQFNHANNSDGTLNVGQGTINNFKQFANTYNHNPLVLNERYVHKINFNGTTAPSDSSAYTGTNNGEFFPNQSNISDLNVSDLNMSNAQNMSGMFSGMTKLTNSDYGNTLTLGTNQFNTNSANSMHDLFKNDSALNNLSLNGGFNTQNVSDMSKMFNGMTALQNLDLSNADFDTSNVRNMSDMFDDLSNVQNLTLGNKFNTRNASDSTSDNSGVDNMNKMFNGLSNLKNLNLGNQFNTGTKTSATDILSKSLLPNDATLEGQWGGVNYTLNLQTGVLNVSGPGKLENFGRFAKEHPNNPLVLESKFVKKINFQNKITLPSDCSAYDGSDNQDEFFPNQEGIQDLNPTNLDTSDVKNMKGMFSNMHNLTNSDYGHALNLKFHTNNVSDTSDMFKSDSQLQHLNLGSDTDGNNYFNTTNDSRMDDMFNGMNSLENLDLGLNFHTNQTTSNGSDMIKGLNSLSDLKGTWDTAHYDLHSASHFANKDGVLSVSDGNIDKFGNRDANYPHDPLVQNETKINQVLFNNNVKAPSDCSAYVSDNGNGNYVFNINNSFNTSDNTVSDGVSNSGNGEFFPNQHNITDLKLSGLDTSNVKNMNGMFSGMVNVSNNDLKGEDHDTLIVGNGSFNTPNVTNMANLFNESNSHASMSIPNIKFKKGFNTQNVTTMNNMFNGASNTDYASASPQNGADLYINGNPNRGLQWNVNSINFDSDPNFTTKNVSDLHDMFQHLYFVNGNNIMFPDSGTGSQTLDFSHNDLRISPKAHSLNDMFSDLSDIGTLNLRGVDNNHGFNSSNYIGKGLTDRNGSDVTSNVSDMSYMFNGLYGLEHLKLGNNFDTSYVTNMDHMFNNFRNVYGTQYNNGGLSNLFLGPKFRTNNVSDMRYMFTSDISTSTSNPSSDQSDLSGGGIYFGNQFNTENVSDMTGMFNQNALHSLDLTTEAKDNACSDSDPDKDMAQTYERPNRFQINTRSLKYMDSMFNALSSAINIKLDNHFNTSQVQTMNNVFSDCSLLPRLVLDSDFITNNVTSMHAMFANDGSLSDIDFDKNFNVGNVNDMSWMFANGGTGAGTMNLKLNVPTDSDNGDNKLCLNPNHSSNLTDVNWMFSGANMNSVDMSGLKTGSNGSGSDLTSTVGMFSGAQIHSDLNLSDFDTHNVNDMSDMFQSSSIKNLNQELPLINTDNISDMDYMFANISNPSDLDMYKFDTTRNNKQKTMRSMFSGDYLPNGRIIFGDSKNNHGTGKFDTSDVYAMSNMFGGITIPNINVSDINTKSAQYMDSMFNGANVSNGIDLPNTDPNSPNYYKKSEFWQPNPQVTTTNSMFGNINIPSLDVSGMNTKSVSDMSYMFDNAHVPSPINFGKVTSSFEKSPDSSQFNTAHANNMQSMFQDVYSNENPQTLDLSTFNTGNVKHMDNMFNAANTFYDPNSNPGVNNRGRLNLGNEFDTSQVRSISGMFANLPIKTIGFSPLDDINLGNDFKLANCKAYGSDEWNGDDNGDDPDNVGNWNPQDNNGPSSRNQNWVGMFANDGNMNSVDLSHLWPGLDGSGLLSSDNSLSDINLHDFYLRGRGIPYVQHTEYKEGSNGHGYYNYEDNNQHSDMAETQYSDNQPNPYKNFDALRADTENMQLLTIDLNKNDTFRRDNGEDPKHKNFFYNNFDPNSSYVSDISHNPAMGQASDKNHRPLYIDDQNDGVTYTLKGYKKVKEQQSDNKTAMVTVPVYVDNNGNQVPISNSKNIQPDLVMMGDPSQFWYSDATNLNSDQQKLANDGIHFVNWHHFTNYTDGYWYHVDNEGHLSRPTNLQDTKSRTGTWFRNKGVNVIVYVDQNGHNTVVKNSYSYNSPNDFGNYIKNNHPGLPFGTWIPDPSTDIVISQGNNPNEGRKNWRPGMPTDYIGLVHIFGEPTSGEVQVPARFYQSDVTINEINNDPNKNLDHTGVVPLYYSGFIGGTYSDASINNLIDHKTFDSDGGYIAKAVVARTAQGQWVNAKGNSVGDIIPASVSGRRTQNFPSALVWQKGKEPMAIYVYHHIFKEREHMERIPYQFVLPDGNPVNINDQQQYMKDDNGTSVFHYGTRGIPLPKAPDGYSIYEGNETNNYDPIKGQTMNNGETYNLYKEQGLSSKVINIDRNNTPQPSTGQTKEYLIPIIGDVEEASGPVTYKLVYDGRSDNFNGNLPQYMQGIVDIKGQIGQNNKQNNKESHRVGTVVNFTINNAAPNEIPNFVRDPSDDYTGMAYLKPHDAFSWIETGFWDNVPRSDNGYLRSDFDPAMDDVTGRPMFVFHGEGAQITYQYGNKTESTKYTAFAPQVKTDQSGKQYISDVPSKAYNLSDLPTVPKGYHIVLPNGETQINVNANQNNIIMVVPDSVRAIGKWGDAFYTLDNQGTLTLSQSDPYFPPTYSQKTVSDHTTVPSDVKDKNGHVVMDPKTHKPKTYNKPVVTYHTITVANDGEMKTTKWPSDVLYVASDGKVTSKNNNYANNGGTTPYALNKDAVKHIQFQGHVVLPSDSTDIFGNLANLESFNGNNADTSNVTNMSNMFNQDPQLSQADMGTAGIANLQNTSNMFAKDPNLTNVNLSHWSNGSLTNMNNMFESDSRLNGSDIKGISDLNIGKLTDAGGVFASDPALTSLNFGNNSAKSDSAVTNLKMTGTFRNDPNLHYLDLSRFTPKSVTGADTFANDFVGDLENNTYQVKMDANKLRFAPQSHLDGHWTTNYGVDPSSPILDQSGTTFSDATHTWQKVYSALIKINYMDTNDHQVGTGQISDTYVGAPDKPLPTTDSQAYANGLSQNYTLNSGQLSNYAVSSDNANYMNNYTPVVDLDVTGNQVSRRLPINVVYENSDGTTTGQPNEVHTNVILNFPYDQSSDSFNYSPSDVDHLAGYTLDTNNTGQSSFKVNVSNNNLSWNQGTPTVYFKANASANNNFTINQVVVSPKGVVLSSTPVQVPIQSVFSDVNVGKTYQIDPDKVPNPSDTLLANSTNSSNVPANNPINVKVLDYNSTGQAYVQQPRNNTWYYVRTDRDANGQILVNYLDQNNANVGSTTRTGYKGSTLYLTGCPIPGYHYDGNNPKNSVKQMTYGSTKQTANVYVVGNNETIPIKYDYDGKQLASDTMTGLVGNDVDLHTNKIPAGYALKPGASTNEIVTYQSDGRMPSDVLPLISEDRIVPVKFQDVNHSNHQVGPVNYSVRGKIDGHATLPNAPKGYAYDNASDQNYTFNLSDANSTNSDYMKIDNVPVHGTSSSVEVDYVDQDGNSTDNGRDNYVIEPSDNKIMGDTVTLHNVPKGYQLDSSRVNGFNNVSGNLKYTFDPQNIAEETNGVNVMNKIVVHTIGNPEAQVPVKVELQYEDDKGHFVGAAKSDQITLNNVHVGSMYNLDPQTLVPANYQLDKSAGRTPDVYQAQIDNNGNADWLTQNGKAVIYLKDNAGVAGKVTITKVEETPDGQIVGVYPSDQQVPVSGSVGDKYDLDYTQYNNVPNYHLAAATDPNGNLNQDVKGQVTDHGLTNNHAVLYYVANPVSDIDVHYRIPGKNSDVSSDDYGNHKAYYGEQINGLSDIPKGYLLDRNNPKNYTNGQLNQFTFGKQTDATVYIKANQISHHTVPVKIIVEDPSDNEMSNNTLHIPSVVNVPVNEGNFTIDPNHNPALQSIINDGFSSTSVPVTGTLNGNNFDMSDDENDSDNTFTYNANYEDAGKIAVQFINQNGQYVDRNGNPVSETDYPKYYVNGAGKDYRGEPVANVVSASIGDYPIGYNYVGGRLSDMFDGNDRNDRIIVKGTNEEDNVEFNLTEEDPNGKYIRTVSFTQPINTVIGNTYAFNSNDYQPDGFSDVDYDHPTVTKLTVRPDGTLSNNGQVNFTYKLSSTNQNLKDITVDYKNDETGQIVDQSDVTPNEVNKVYNGMPISDVTKYATPPKAYTLDDGQYKQAVMSQNQTFVTLMVHPTSSAGKGSQDSDVAQPILVTFRDASNGNQPVHSYSDIPVEGNMGQTIDVLDYCQIPSGYRLDDNPNVNYTIDNKVTKASIYVRPNRDSSVPYHLTVKVVSPTATDASHSLTSDTYTKVIPISDSLTVDPASRTNPIDGSQLPNTSDYTLSDNLSSIKSKLTFTNNNGTLTSDPAEHNTLVYRAKADPNNLGQMTVQYYDGDHQISVPDNVITQGYNGHHFYDGEQFKSSDLMNLVPVPQGYQINSDETNNGPLDKAYTMNTIDHVIKLYVHGTQAVRGVAKITLNEYDPYNKKLIASPVVSDVVNGTVGDSYEIDPNNFVPNGYQLDNPKYAAANHVYKGLLNAHGVSDGSKNVQFYYQLPSSAAKNVQPITVKYIDGNYPVTTRTISAKPNVDYVGEKIANVTRDNEAGIPNGYKIDPTDQNVSAVFGETPQTMTINITADTAKSSGTFFVIENLYDHTGKKLIKTNVKPVPMSGIVGKSSKISDGMYPIPAGYQRAINHHSDTVIYTPSGLSKSSTSYNYDSDPTKPIYTKYLYDGDQVGNVQKITTDDQGHTMYMNEPIDIARGIPTGYQLSPNQNTIEKASESNDQRYDLNVEPVPDYSKVFELTIVRHDPNGKVISTLPALKVPVRISVPVGTKQLISTANLNAMVTPDFQQLLNTELAGFKPSTSQGSDVNVINGSSQLTPSIGTFNYNAETNVKPINVVYYNQHGQMVKSDKLTNGYMDQNVSDVTKATGLPNGYKLMPGLHQPVSYTFGNQPQTANLMVTGDAETNPVHVQIFEDGNYSRTVSDYIHGNVGDDITVDANNFVPQGYKLAPDHQTQVPVAVKTNGIDPASVSFYYVADPNDQAQPIYVTYVNQAGTPVVTNKQLTGARIYGHKVNVYDATKSDLDDKLGNQDYTLADPNVNYTYEYGSDAQYVTIKVTGVKTQNTYQVNQIMNDNGKRTSDVVTKSVAGRVGDKLTLNPYDYVPSDYSVDPDDANQQITLVPKNIDDSQAQPDPVNFTYDSMDSADHLIYENDSDDNAIVNERDVTGPAGTQLTYGNNGVVSYSDGDGHQKQIKLPNGYEFEGYGQKDSQIGNHNDVIYVKRIPAKRKYGLIIIKYEDVSGKTPKPLSSDTVNYQSRAAGTEFNLNQFEFSDMPTNYQFKELKSSPIYSFNAGTQELTIGVVPVKPTIYSTITVKYMNGDKLVNSEAIVGQVGSKFDSGPYEEDIPEGHYLKQVESAPKVFGRNNQSCIIQIY